MFNEMNDAQILWYQIQLNLDYKEKFEMFRDIAEHNAMFTNPEGVKQVRESRENSFHTSDEDFNKLLKNLFGKNIDFKNDIKSEDISQTDSQTSKYSPIINMNLDEIKFTPFK